MEPNGAATLICEELAIGAWNLGDEMYLEVRGFVEKRPNTPRVE
ncbi:MAG: hypothetical protein ACYCPT_05960 [Acidimicrobiales bacterium]